VQVTIRKEKGNDVSAACGQLVIRAPSAGTDCAGGDCSGGGSLGPVAAPASGAVEEEEEDLVGGALRRAASSGVTGLSPLADVEDLMGAPPPGPPRVRVSIGLTMRKAPRGAIPGEGPAPPRGPLPAVQEAPITDRFVGFLALFTLLLLALALGSTAAGYSLISLGPSAHGWLLKALGLE